MLGLLELRIFEATGADVESLDEVHGHRLLRIRGKGEKYAIVPLPPAVGRAIDRAVDGRTGGPILRHRNGNRMDRNGACRRLSRLAVEAGLTEINVHPHMLRHTFVTTMLDAGVDLRDVQIAAPSRRPAHDHAVRPGTQESRPPPELHLGRVHGLSNTELTTWKDMAKPDFPTCESKYLRQMTPDSQGPNGSVGWAREPESRKFGRGPTNVVRRRHWGCD